MSIEKIDKYCDELNAKYRKKYAIRMITLSFLLIATGWGGYYFGTQHVNEDVYFKHFNYELGFKGRILPPGYQVSEEFDATYWGKDGKFPDNQYPAYIQALKGGKVISIGSPHRSYCAFTKYDGGEFGLSIGVESKFEDTQQELYMMADGEWRWHSISDDFKTWID